jgi:hypothetical protein
MGERRGEVINWLVEITPKNDASERRGEVINWLVEIVAKC